MDRNDPSRFVPFDQPGGVYCSPRCGGGCKRSAFERATAEANALAARMGDGWRPDVWENLGWHYVVTKGDHPHHRGIAEVHPSFVRPGYPHPDDGKFSAWINSATDGIGQVITEYFADPVEAMGLALQEARTRALRYSAELDGISA